MMINGQPAHVALYNAGQAIGQLVTSYADGKG